MCVYVCVCVYGGHAVRTEHAERVHLRTEFQVYERGIERRSARVCVRVCARMCVSACVGNIRRAEHFVAFMRRLLAYMRERMRSKQVVHETPPTFLQSLQEKVAVDAKTLK